MFHVCLLLKEGKGVLGSEKHYPVRNISVVWCGQLLQADTVIDQVFVAAWVQRLESGDTATITSGHRDNWAISSIPSSSQEADTRHGWSEAAAVTPWFMSIQRSFVLFCISWPLWVTASKTFLSYLHRKQSSVLTSDRPDQSCDLRTTSSASYY